MYAQKSCLAVILFGIGIVGPASVAGGVTLGISADGKFFTINGVPTFLNGVSYYGAQTISTSSYMTQDLDDMVADGFNWIRVWAMFGWYPDDSPEDVSVMTPNGVVREPYMTRFKTLITECNNRGMIVDCTMNRGAVLITNYSQHLACMQTLATQLLPYRNVYFDVANERNIQDARYVSMTEVGQLINAVKAIDSTRICTASGGRSPKSQDELNNYKTIGKVDFLAPHLCREEGCSAEHIDTVEEFIGWMSNLGFRIPVHLQEPFRRGYASYNPVVADFYRDCTGVKVAEAAGWCLHNGDNKFTDDYRPWRCFNMSDPEGRLYAQFDSVEQTVAGGINNQIGSTDVAVRRYQVEYAEQLPHLVGRQEGYAWSANTAQDSANYLNYGPDINTLSASGYEVDWRMMIDNHTANNEAVVILDVYDPDGGGVLASRTVTRQEFSAANTYQEFMLTFTYTNPGHRLEFRTYWLDKAYIKLDYVEVRSQSVQPNVPPVIAEVAPDPDPVYAQQAYMKQLILLQGYPSPTWSVVAGPPGTQVSADGWVSGWTPSGQSGTLYDFSIQATNPVGSDIESWQVRIDSIAPVIAEVTPDPDPAAPTAEYVRQLILLQGVPAPIWAILVGPSGAQVDANGRVSGWTPGVHAGGSLVDFTVQAVNVEASDIESWQVRVKHLGDFDDDLDVDQEDFGHLQGCLCGHGGMPCAADCSNADLNSDGDVDLDDFGIFQGCMSGANVPADPTCAE